MHGVSPPEVRYLIQGAESNLSAPITNQQRSIMFKFYDADKGYIDFLKTIDNKIPNIEYGTHNKFVCGIVLSINGINYYAPVSHFNKPQKTNFPIRHKGNIIASIRFCFMFPVISGVLTEKDFGEIAKTDKPYADLLSAEYSYCKMHLEDILKRANKVYDIGCNKSHFLNHTCCDFKKLEKFYLKYNT